MVEFEQATSVTVAVQVTSVVAKVVVDASSVVNVAEPPLKKGRSTTTSRSLENVAPAQTVGPAEMTSDNIAKETDLKLTEQRSKSAAIKAKYRANMSVEQKQIVKDKATVARNIKSSHTTGAAAFAAKAAKKRLRDARTPAQNQAATRDQHMQHMQTIRASQDQVDKDAVKEQNKARRRVQRASLSEDAKADIRASNAEQKRVHRSQLSDDGKAQLCTSLPAV